MYTQNFIIYSVLSQSVLPSTSVEKKSQLYEVFQFIYKFIWTHIAYIF